MDFGRLQWGHAYSAWNTFERENNILERDHASMGPRLFSVEYFPVLVGATDDKSLQWGHAYSAWNTWICYWKEFADVIASMGPRLFSVEYCERIDFSQRPFLASMGPRLFSVEYYRVHSRINRRVLGFNGATLIQRGIHQAVKGFRTQAG